MTGETDPVALSGALVTACKGGDRTAAADHLERLGDWDRTELLDALEDDAERKAFWINVYNAAVQQLLGEDPDRYDDRRSFFGTEYVTVAGEDLSLDDVEHGILRDGQSSLGLGYLRTPGMLLGEFVRAAAVDELDYRIHFALNCGATACPPIAAYTAEGIDEQLDLATESYLHSTVEYDSDAGRTTVPRLLLWYRGDFGGRSGIYRLLQQYGPVPEGTRPSVSYDAYDWSLDLGNFRGGPAESSRP